MAKSGAEGYGQAGEEAQGRGNGYDQLAVDLRQGELREAFPGVLDRPRRQFEIPWRPLVMVGNQKVDLEFIVIDHERAHDGDDSCQIVRHRGCRLRPDDPAHEHSLQAR